MEAFTPRNVAKYVAQAVIAAKTSSLTQKAIVERTQFEKDDMIVDISGTLVGWAVSAKLKPVTDGMVDKTADWVVAYRDKQSQKKDTPESE